ncbi:Cof-type HAD-IIB family hydrolase [Maledivibacter halophilus]|uniref:Cof subfamily of IIB subfamily of haloacid dehalogenase superfamily/HAD-superfamily hydrolase, subfamily IIB n=1 Tax=Maledivibacter halophilus TaxID=36842 RepID=A0A1T5MI64_9FIRM|nr:Cof-type HAD-IIB family hydrolase [Maledivibacter halophilus]SKC87900.1 hypothetical protein SAMN02194393_04773 [Maledivibacter halophilus]
MYKMIALDVDGTLIGSDGVISQETKASINAAIKKDIKIILISGREAYSINIFAKELNLNQLIVSLNGAMVIDSQLEKIFFRKDIEPEITENIIKICEEKNISMVLFSGNELFANHEDEDIKLFRKYSHAPVNNVGKLSDFYKNHLVSKVLMIADNKKLLEVKGALEKSYSQEINIEFSKPFFLEIYNKNTSKGIMLKKIADYYGIESKEIIAIGDGENDISMIEYAGMGVAMGNALENVKEKADFITLPQSENGVGYAIEKILF